MHGRRRPRWKIGRYILDSPTTTRAWSLSCGQIPRGARNMAERGIEDLCFWLIWHAEMLQCLCLKACAPVVKFSLM